MIPANQEDVCTVISIMPIQLKEYKPLFPALYTIPACKNVENDCEALMVMRGHFKVYVDENRPALIIPEPSDVIAGAICRDFKVSVTDYVAGIAEPGLFWTRGGYTRDEAIAAKELKKDFETARALQKAWFKNLVATADDDWARHSMRKMISDLQRIACKTLGLEREWDIDLEVSSVIKQVNCKFCQAPVHPDAIICMHCRGVLDMAKFRSDFVSVDKAQGDKVQ